MEQGTPTMQELMAELAHLQQEINLVRARRARTQRSRGMVLLLLVSIGVLLALLVTSVGVVRSPSAGSGSGMITMGTADLQPLVFRVDSSEAMRLAPSGNLGIGTSSPTSRLDVNGSIHSSGTVETAAKIAAGGDLQVAGNGIITGTLNAIGGLHENGSPLRSTYISHFGSYTDPAWIKSLVGTKISGPVANATNAGSAVTFTGNLSGDVTGTQPSTTVRKLRGVALSSTSPADGQVLEYNSGAGQWQPTGLPKTLPRLAYLTKNDSASPNGGHAFGKVFCAAGTRVLGGGVTGSNNDAYIVESAPDQANNSWDYFVTNSDALSTDNVQVWVICA
jgi:hypothetical protein